MELPVIALIGTGNMGTALISGLIRNGHPADKIWGASLNENALLELKKRFQINTTTNNLQAAQAADVIILAVKPQILVHIVTALAKIIETRKPLVISIAAGIRTSSLEQWLNRDIAIVRAMPNMPALIACGATALFANAKTTEQQRNTAESIMRAVGVVAWLSEEKLIDAATALSGNGPAYFFLVMDILQQCAQQLGLPYEISRLLTLETALGAARMAIESGATLHELRRNVASPGGTTEQALSILEKNNIREIFKNALQASILRSNELAESLGEKN